MAIIVSVPMFYGFQQLEVSFDTRDNFDDSVPVVADFLMLADEFQSSPAPLYVVVDGDVTSPEGRATYSAVIELLNSTEEMSGLPIGIWGVLEDARVSNSNSILY